jgi:tRNA G18 (ribose-2'-O)-methylase SpoU
LPIIDISDAGDERLRLYRDVRDRDLTGREGAFMAEGKVVLERLFASRLSVTLSVMSTPERLDGLDMSALGPQVPVYSVAQDVMDQVAGFAIHRGYLALGRYGPVPPLSEVLSKPKVRVLVLSEIANTDNMGGLMRNAAAFGVDAVILDDRCCDPLYRKALRVSVGGVLKVPHYRVPSGQGLIKVLNDHGLMPMALTPSGDRRLDEVSVPDRVAVIMGAEGPGLDLKILAACENVRIDMHGGFDSLNVATTSGIVLHHVCR